MSADFEQEIENKLNPESEETDRLSYSREYQVFKEEQTSRVHSLYEKACRFAGRFKVKVSEQKRSELNSYFTLAHIEATPEGVYALTYMVTLVILALSILAFFTLGLAVFLIGVAMTFSALFALPRIPKFIYSSWRARASDQLVLAIVYLVIYMKRDANLENAVFFVAKHLPPPISLDFMKILWDVETKTHTTIRESLEFYVAGWKDKASAFVDSIHLIETSLVAPNDEQAKSLLTKATDTIIEGTHDNMVHYAHTLQNPVTMIHMLGVVLPILLLIMLPMVSAFMGDIIKPFHLFIGYNVVLPLFVYSMVLGVIRVRPGGTATGDIKLFAESKSRPKLRLGGFEISLPLKVLSILVLSVFLLPFIFYFSYLVSSGLATSVGDIVYSDVLFYLSILAIFGLGLSIAVYYRLEIGSSLKRKRKTEKLEEQFSAAVFQLGSRIQEDVPAEMAFGAIAESTKGTEVSEFFSTVDKNMRQRGMSLKDAIMDGKVGALTLFPSSTIKSVMALVIEGVKKSPKVVSESLTTISVYLTNMHRVSERLKDLLAETIASMQMQARFLAPLIAAIVISLTVLISKVLLNLGVQIADISKGGLAGAPVGGLGLVSLFGMEAVIPPFVLQIIIGIYVIEVIILLSYLLSGVIYGRDEIERKWMISTNLFYGMLIYALTAVIASWLFSQIAETVTGTVL